MRTLILLLATVSAIAALPGVARLSSRQGKHFHFRYETKDGSVREETVHLKAVGKETVPYFIGSVKWPSPEGRVYSYKYEADEKGFRAQGAHIPDSAHTNRLSLRESDKTPALAPPAPVLAPPANTRRPGPYRMWQRVQH